VPRRSALRPRALLVASLGAVALLAPHAAAVPVSEAAPRLLPATAVAPQQVALAAAPAAAPVDAGSCESLRRRVDEALAGSTASTVGVAVDVDGCGPLVRRAATDALPPASTQKSYVAAAALLGLAPDARYRTEVVANRVPVLGRLRGDLWLVAGGDPYLTSGYLRGLARYVREAGITSVSGRLLLDDLRYDQRRRAEGWKASYVPEQSGPLSALAVDGNRWRRDAAYLADPAFPAAELFRTMLVEEGVAVSGGVERAPRPPRARTVAVHHGTTLPEALRKVLKNSDNFAAELLLKEVGHVVRRDGSTAGGLRAVSQLLASQGVALGTSGDGSGLSAVDRQTPEGQVALLRAAETSGTAPRLREAMAVACQDGTLQRRMCGTAAAGRVQAKTGTLPGVRALAGWTSTLGGRTVRFAVQLRGVSDGGRALAAIDRAVNVLASEPG
jgi:serine-type D-Ala-D-Ala carboxypeptidase/endopeptidase (penicillin-binding protein 4)